MLQIGTVPKDLAETHGIHVKDDSDAERKHRFFAKLNEHGETQITF